VPHFRPAGVTGGGGKKLPPLFKVSQSGSDEGSEVEEEQRIGIRKYVFAKVCWLRPPWSCILHRFTLMGDQSECVLTGPDGLFIYDDIWLVVGGRQSPDQGRPEEMEWGPIFGNQVSGGTGGRSPGQTAVFSRIQVA